MKTRSNQNARVGKTKRILKIGKLKLTEIINSIEEQPRVISDLKSN